MYIYLELFLAPVTFRVIRGSPYPRYPRSQLPRYEKYKSPTGVECHAVAGYCTVYEYYAYPDRTRPRVSQMLVLPPFQRRGLGVHLLCSVYQHYRGVDAVTDITVEDPNEEFQHLRDYVDASLCSTLDSFSPDKLRMGFNPAMANEACLKFKINKKQARRVYEILRLKETNIHDESDYSSYRLDVKRRLNIPFQKETALIKKLKSQLEQDPQLSTALGLKTPEQRFDTLDKMFTETEKEYKTILRRMEERPLPTNMF
ncbi:histone acetyltransferase 1 [Homalodisca vitripennis]|nr:histone acetyltransferase 1 [Homalodisca vitripennis]